MAIYHCDVKPVQRSKGQTTTAKMAYRAGAKIGDKRTGKTHDYTAKRGVEHKEIITPQGVNIPSREDLWNMAELAERRKDACTGREYEVNLPYELTKEQRVELCRDFARELASRHGVAVDICMHEPSKEGDQRNYHAHIMTTTRIITNDGLTEKADIEKAGRKRKDDLKQTRELWANMANKHLEKAQIGERIDHRSFKEQGKDQQPTVKMGWQATQIEREGKNSFLGDINREIKAKNDRIANLKYEIVFDKGVLQNHLTLESLDNVSNEQVKSNFTKRDLSEIERYKQHSQAKITNITEKADKEPLTQDDIKTYEQWKTINNSIVELEQTGVLAEKEKLTQEKNQKQSELTAVSEPSPQPKTPTPLETHSKRLEPQENKQATPVAPKLEKPLQSENKPPSEPKPKTLKEYLTGLSHENRQKIKNHYNKVINDYIGAIDKKAVELYHKATPPNKRQKPLFSHYKEHDMDAVQPFKQKAVNEIEKLEAGSYQKYAKAVDTINELNSIEQSERLQQNLEQMLERNRTPNTEIRR